ncbi:MAG TPA: serine/threonine-protein kinase, partial [Rugosimonospora sp.]|nr:serine/threonine-protein kinase [Rugosimonospora sp.]
MAPTQTPLIAGRYRLVSQLGHGGMGTVWLGRDEVLHRDVAMKEVTPPEGLPAEERAAMGQRSLREARAIARLAHPNVVRVYDIVRQDPWPWIVMEYVPSRSLDQVLRGDGPMPPADAARVGLGVLGALRAAHSAGMVHRDVKPANVLLADDGRVVLTDFGLATLEGDPTVTRPGVIIGSPAFMAPERAAHGVSSPESDLWSLGAMLHAAVEGKSPYARTGALATLTALATEEPDPAPHAGPLGEVIAGLLRRDPAERTGSTDVLRQLRRIARPL